MIVKCEQCQTRFKIPDEKVTDKGVKVRCTKCQHTFRVNKDGPMSAAPGSTAATTKAPAFVPGANPAPGSTDPFSQFGATSDFSGESTRPGMKIPPLAFQQQSGDFDAEESPTRVAPLPRELLAMRQKGPLGLVSPAAVPAAAAAPAGAIADPFGFADLNGSATPAMPSYFPPTALGDEPPAPTRQQRPLAADLTHPGTPGWPSADPFSGAGAAVDPFASFGGAVPAAPAGASTEVAQVATREVPAWPGSAPPDGGAYGVPAETQNGYAVGGAPDPGYGQYEAVQAWPSQGSTDQHPGFQPPADPAEPSAAWSQAPSDAQPAQPWDFSAPVPEATQTGASPFDFSGGNLRQEAAAPAPGPQHDFASEPPAPTQNAFALPGGSIPAATIPYTAGPYSAGAAAPVEPPTPSGSASYDAQLLESDPFAAASFSPQESGGLLADVPPDAGPERGDASSLFGAPPPAPEPEPSLPPPPSSSGLELASTTPSALGRLGLVKAPAPSAPTTPAGSAPTAAAAKPEAAEVDVGPDVEAPRRRRAAAAIVANIVVAALLLIVVVGIGTVFLNEGRFDLSSLSFQRVKEYLAASKDLVAVEISNGLYETKGGRSVFFVRGEVVNRTGHAARVKVRAEIYDGDQLVRSADGWAGMTPSPEDLYAVSAADDLDRLHARLLSGVRAVAPGDNVAFLVPFYEYPSDLKGIRVKVVLTAADGAASTAAR